MISLSSVKSKGMIVGEKERVMNVQTPSKNQRPRGDTGIEIKKSHVFYVWIRSCQFMWADK